LPVDSLRACDYRFLADRMKVLIIGAGGREHALAWKLAASPAVEHVWCVPGNAGIARDAECVPGGAGDVPGLVELATRLKPDLTVVGPELPLVAGIADEFRARGLRILGPSRAAARLEGSKIFAKEFLERHGIPTASPYGIYDSPGDAYAALCAVDWPVVVKADGLCAGKGVLVTRSPDEATGFIERLMDKREFGDSGSRILLEEALEGEELSYIVLTDGEHLVPMLAARDHKRVFDGNEGPNTGGMGAYCSDRLLSPEAETEVLEKVVRPTIEGMAREGCPYAGFLYFGLMLTEAGPKVLEFNCRMGDPEAQPIVARMDFDLGEAAAATVDGRLSEIEPQWKPGASLCVVLASGGYPGSFQSGKRIEGLEKAEKVEGVKVFHAATRFQGGSYYTSGGRVLGVTATGGTLADARRSCYYAVSCISFDGMHFRKDIGQAEQQAQAQEQGR
jgi:phosphoribosylamine---glycine ligase